MIDSPLLDGTVSLRMLAEAVTLCSARFFGAAIVFPMLSRRHLSPLHQAAVCLCVSAFQWDNAWATLSSGDIPTLRIAALVVKEAVLGFLLGYVLSIPFWAVTSAFTLVDNQRGANAAQVSNPSMQADASLLGELAERALIAALVDTPLCLFAFEFTWQSYLIWPLWSGWPAWPTGADAQMTGWFIDMLAAALAFAAPFILLMLVIEAVMAITSLAVQGLDVYQLAMPIKSASALLLMALVAVSWFSAALHWVDAWWHGALRTLMRMFT